MSSLSLSWQQAMDRHAIPDYPQAEIVVGSGLAFVTVIWLLVVPFLLLRQRDGDDKNPKSASSSAKASSKRLNQTRQSKSSSQSQQQQPDLLSTLRQNAASFVVIGWSVSAAGTLLGLSPYHQRRCYKVTLLTADELDHWQAQFQYFVDNNDKNPKTTSSWAASTVLGGPHNLDQVQRWQQDWMEARVVPLLSHIYGVKCKTTTTATTATANGGCWKLEELRFVPAPNSDNDINAHATTTTTTTKIQTIQGSFLQWHVNLHTGVATFHYHSPSSMPPADAPYLMGHIALYNQHLFQNWLATYANFSWLAWRIQHYCVGHVRSAKWRLVLLLLRDGLTALLAAGPAHTERLPRDFSSLHQDPRLAAAQIQELHDNTTATFLRALDHEYQQQQQEQFTNANQRSSFFWEPFAHLDANVALQDSCPATAPAHCQRGKHPDDDNAWEPGDLNQLFQRLAQRDNATVWSRPTTSIMKQNQQPSRPWIISMDDFLTPDETERFIHWGTVTGFQRSLGVGTANDNQNGGPTTTMEQQQQQQQPNHKDSTPPTSVGVVSQDRTSSNTWCEEDCQKDPVIQSVLQRLQDLVQIPLENAEKIQLLHYKEGEFYRRHHDYVSHERYAMEGPRILTIFFYLNNVEQGGETRFYPSRPPTASQDMDSNDADADSLTVTPKAGRIVLWPSVWNDAPHVRDPRTEHEAMPVMAGFKYGANAWYHLRSISKAVDRGC